LTAPNPIDRRQEPWQIIPGWEFFDSRFVAPNLHTFSVLAFVSADTYLYGMYGVYYMRQNDQSCPATLGTMRSSSHGQPRPSFLTAPLITGEESVEGASLLTEVSGPIGVLLWGTYRDTMAWLKTAPKKRPALFADGSWRERRLAIDQLSHVDEKVRAALLKLAGLSSDEGPANSEQVACASLALAAWADEHNLLATRLAFTQLAALAIPTNPKLTLETGKLARELALYPKAESWLRKAIRVARRTKDWDTYIWSYIALAVLYMRLGNHPASQALTERVLRTAKHHRLKGMEGLAYHQFFILEAQSKHPREAYGYAHQALAAYGNSHPRLTALAHDVARFWVDQGHFARALCVFEAALGRVEHINEQAVVMANVAHAAAGAGAREKYEKARQHVLELIARMRGETAIAEVFAILAYADVYIGEFARADEATEIASATAIRRKETEVLRALEALKPKREQAWQISRCSEEPPGLARQADKLAGELRRSLCPA
jgi:tetratricopeptide (TPR) repeat protein